MKTRKEAALELMGVWNNYEVRPIKFSTAYRWVYKNNCGFWQLNGHAHDYILYEFGNQWTISVYLKNKLI